MFEVDTWETSGNGEEKLLQGLFGDHSKRKRKRQQHKTLPNEGKDKDNFSKSSTKSDDTSKEDSSIQIHNKGKVMKKRKSSHLVKEDETAQTPKHDETAMTNARKRRKRKKDKGITLVNKEGLQQNVKTEVDEKKQGKKKKKKKKTTHVLNDNLSNIDTCTSHTSPEKVNLNDKNREIPLKTEKYEKCINKDSTKISSVVPGQQSPNKGGESLPRAAKSRKSQLQEKLKQKLESSRFRWINEQLYTIPGEKAMEMFQEDQSLFDVYHQGFRRQVERWPVNPVDVIIDWIKQRSSSIVLADFGCGEAIIAQSVPNKVHSFDLVAKNKLVTACNMAKVPLQAACIDVAIYCLSLMGTDLEAFLREAYRVLKPGGILKIAEVVSRMEVNTFILAVCQLGFKLDNMDDSNKMFVLLDFVKDHQNKKIKGKKDLSCLQLKPCMYKKR